VSVCGSSVVIKELSLPYRSDFPGGFHELNEMVVVVNGGGDSGVVVIPFLAVNFTVTVFVTEVSEELEEDLVLSHLSGDNLRVHVGGVDSLEIGGLDGTVAIVVELEEGLVNHSLSFIVESSLFTFK
jgi:hypothetical protein